MVTARLPFKGSGLLLCTLYKSYVPTLYYFKIGRGKKRETNFKNRLATPSCKIINFALESVLSGGFPIYTTFILHAREVRPDSAVGGQSIKTGLGRPLSCTTIYIYIIFLSSFPVYTSIYLYNVILYRIRVKNSRNIGLCIARPL